MKSLLRVFFFLFIPVIAVAQQDAYVESWTNKQADSLRVELDHTTNDTMRMKLSRSLGWHYQDSNRDSSLYFHEQELALAKKLNLKLWEADAFDQVGWVSSQLKNYALSLQYFLEGIKILENEDCEKNIWLITLFSKEKDPQKARLSCLGFIYNDLSQLYSNTGNSSKELTTLYQGLKIGKDINNYTLLALITSNVAYNYYQNNQLDSALKFGQQSLQYISISGYTNYKGYVLNTIGNIYLKQNKYALARQYFDSSISVNKAENNLVNLTVTYSSLADLYKSQGKIDTSIFYAKKALADFKSLGLFDRVNLEYTFLYDLYKSNGNTDSAYVYVQLSKTLGDSLNKAEKDKIYAYQNIGFNEQIKAQEQENERIQRENTKRIYTLIAAIVVFMLIAFLLYRNSRNRRKANELLQKQKEEIEFQKRNVEGTLSELKSTQSQLIQSEKMASLGELTAGIAHEIQNPLNFVNNFSDVNKELLVEMKDEMNKGNLAEANEIANDVIANEEKINHHGKRADAIVKGMLQHSQSSTGKKEPTDINALCDEYLRLSYHGLRAKDKSFNVTMKSDFDASLEKINIIPQDIGRVILNLLNNAFYAVDEKKVLRQAQDDSSYEPTVSISTKKLNDKVQIIVNDNGKGIPQNIVEKIFQPFFTTKPTGQGTGLGLSLSYDIIKAHGGELKVETKENEASQFTITLPLN
jgi:two-component system NtrC family sensor kinase